MQFFINSKLGAETHYILRSVWQDIVQRKFGTFFTILVIAVSLTIPAVGYLIWKNTSEAATRFYPEQEITIYLHNSLSEQDVQTVVQHIRQYAPDKTDDVRYISRQQSLEEFRSWSGFGEALDILEDNPLPAVVAFKPKKEFSHNDALLAFRNGLQQIKGVQEVRLDNGWVAKLMAITWLVARISVACALLMLISVFLVINHSVRSDVSNAKASIEIQQLIGATNYFIARPFLYKGILYGLFGSLLALLFSNLLIGYFTGVVKYVADVFTVKIELFGSSPAESFCFVSMSIFTGWLAAKLATKRYIQKMNGK